MTPHEIQQRKRAAQQRLRAQRLRAGMLRGRVVVISLIAFVVLWGVVFTQMATGNDPVLGDSSSTLASSQRTQQPRRRSPVAPKPAPAPTPKKASPPNRSKPPNRKNSKPKNSTREEFEAEEFEAEPVEEELFLPEEELAPVITSQS